MVEAKIQTESHTEDRKFYKGYTLPDMTQVEHVIRYIVFMLRVIFLPEYWN